jgi:hypothetical protein
MTDVEKTVRSAVGWLSLKDTVNGVLKSFADLQRAQQRYVEQNNKIIGELRERVAKLEENSKSVMTAIEDKAARAASDAVLKSNNDILTRLLRIEMYLKSEQIGSAINVTPPGARQLGDGSSGRGA